MIWNLSIAISAKYYHIHFPFILLFSYSP